MSSRSRPSPTPDRGSCGCSVTCWELFEQTRRALTRCVLGLGEGAKRDGGNRQVAFRRARGEANEALTAIRLAVVWGYLAEEDVASLLEKMNHLVAILVRLTR